MKKYIIIALDILLAAYLVFAIVSFNNPERLVKKCTKVNIDIADESTYGFLDAKEIKSILEKKGLYPIEKDMDDISPRQIETLLSHSAFVSTAQCCKTEDGHVLISVTQRSPLVRIKSITGEDYYIDENGGIMPNSKYTSDLIIVTGSVSKTFARRYISVLANAIMKSDLWRNQIEQINVQHDLGIELVPRVGEHIIFLGYLPTSDTQSRRQKEVTAFAEEKLKRLEAFYKYGLSEAGWNKYERIDVQYKNQIICKKHPEIMKIEVAAAPVPKPEVHEADHPAVEAAAPSEHHDVATNTAKPSEKKAETPKTDTNKSADKKSSDKKSTDKKPETAKSSDKKSTDKKSETKKPSDKKTDTKKSETKKTSDKKAEQKKQGTKKN